MRDTATLPLLLKQLNLNAMYDQWQPKAEEAQQQHWTYPHYLSILTELEVAARYQRRIQRYVKESKLPPGKTLEVFDFKSTPSINAAHIQALADNTSWVRQANNLILFGPSGVGKTHLACAIAYRLIEQGIRVLFTATSHLVQRLQQARNEFKLPDVLARLAHYPVLILDDISYVKKTEVETSVLFELIADRYETNSLIITANQSFSEWDQIFPDQTMAVAAIDRLVHHASIFNIQAESYRKIQSTKH